MKIQKNNNPGKLSHLIVNLIICFSLLSAAAAFRPSEFEQVQAEGLGNGASRTQAGLPDEAPAIRIIYVKKNATGANNGTNWTNAYTSLQSALDTPFIGEGDQIWVAGGVYTPTHQTLLTDTRTSTFWLLPDVEVFGGFKGNEGSILQRNWRLNPSILSGDLLGNDAAGDFPEGPTYSENSYHVVTASTLDKPTRLDGFIVRGGNADAEDPGLVNPFDFGGGIYNKKSEAILVNLTFYKNFAVQGGGLYNIETYSQVINCAFIGNKSDFGGGLRNISSNTTLLNTVLVGNSAYAAGAIYNSSSNPTFVNITMAYNRGEEFANPKAGGILNDNASILTIKNSILWGNYTGQIWNEAGATPSTAELYFSLVQDDCDNDGVSCTGITLETDPRFENLAGTDTITGTLDDNLRLNWTSPAIDAGDNGVVPLDYRDINYNGITDGETLPLDLNNTRRMIQLSDSYTGLGTPPIVDLGAYEAYFALFLPAVRK